jgi:hypothetical protein
MKNPPQPDITRTIEEILDEFAKWTINNVEHGIYIPLPSPEAVQKLVTLVNEAKLNEAQFITDHFDDLHQGTEGAGWVSYGEMGEWLDDRIKELTQ